MVILILVIKIITRIFLKHVRLVGIVINVVALATKVGYAFSNYNLNNEYKRDIHYNTCNKQKVGYTPPV